MQLTFVVDELDEPLSLSVDPSMALEDLQALLEAELSVPASQLAIFFQNRRLPSTNPQATLASFGITSDEMLGLQVIGGGASSSAGQTGAQGAAGVGAGAGRPGGPGSASNDAERERLQILGNPQLMSQLRTMSPELAEAAEHSPERFREFFAQLTARQRQAAEQRRQDEELLHSDPFDIDAQRRIEEHIRQERVLENMEHAMEYSPESFGIVTMLYVNVQVNGVPVKAFVDSGAQMTVISPECAEHTGIMRLLDRRYSGIARGVGTAKILGRVHSAPLRMGPDLHVPCSFTVMEGKGVDLLFGLDMLKRYQASIDLSQNALIIQGRKIPFLAEHELPRNAIGGGAGEDEDAEVLVDGEGNVVVPRAPDAIVQGAPPSLGGAAQRFPGSGQSLGAGPPQTQPASRPAPAAPPAAPVSIRPPPASAASSADRSKVETLVGLGATPRQAEELLAAAGGNVDVAASLLFGN